MPLAFNVVALPFHAMAFPSAVRSHGLAAAPVHGRVALETSGAALGAPRQFLRTQLQLAMALRRRQAPGTP